MKYHFMVYSLDMAKTLEAITAKKAQLDKLRPFPPELIKNLDEWYRVELTYTSNAIEGNTLSRVETALVVEKGITVEGKTIREHLEAVNHARAFEFIQRLAAKKRRALTNADILDIHRIILAGIDDVNAGRYRNIPVRIAGSSVVMPNPRKVHDLMQSFGEWMSENSNDHPALFAAEAHYRLVSIHPFVDGNGRTARLLMNLILMKHGYPPAIIKKEERKRYLEALEKAQLGGSEDDFYTLIEEAVDHSLDLYLEAVREAKGLPIPPKAQLVPERLLKIGEVARQAGEPAPTIRYWTQHGLLDVKEFSRGGYQLYEAAMVERAKQIRRWQNEERLTLAEIKKRVKGEKS